MPEFTRVRDKDTGHEYSVVNVDPDAHEVIDGDAANADGVPLPPTYTTSKKAASKETPK